MVMTFLQPEHAPRFPASWSLRTRALPQLGQENLIAMRDSPGAEFRWGRHRVIMIGRRSGGKEDGLSTPRKQVCPSHTCLRDMLGVACSHPHQSVYSFS